MEKGSKTAGVPSAPFITEGIRRSIIMQALAAEAYDDAIVAALKELLVSKGLPEGDWMVVHAKGQDKPLCQVAWEGDEVFLRNGKGGGKVPYNEDVYAALLGETTEALDKEFENAKLHASAYCRLELVFD